MSKAPVFHTNAVPVKRPLLRPVELTQDEMERLLRAFTAGKTEMLEDDALTLVKWATAQRMGAMLVEMILAGELVPSVKEGEVLVSLPGSRNEGDPTRCPLV
jgi:hypothetical protein